MIRAKKIGSALFALAFVLLGSCSHEPEWVDYVDPLIGSGGHGHVFVGASRPWGMVQVGPSSLPQSWDWCSGYHESDSTIFGFPHTHLSGTGIGDLHDITLMPVVGEVTYARGTESDPESGLWSYSARSRQVVRPGYYATHLLRYGIDVELTATQRVGFHKYTFPAGEESAIVIDLVNGGGWDSPVEGYVRQVSPQRVEGYRYSKGWADDQKVYFVADLSLPVTSVKVMANDSTTTLNEGRGRKIFARLSLPETKGQPVYVKVGISFVSIDNARLNLEQELPHWDFDRVVKEARADWNRELSKVSITSGDQSILRSFYTAYFHAMHAPYHFGDVNGQYRGADGQVHQAEGWTPYTLFSLWDTYRAAHPLYNIVESQRVPDFISTMLSIHEQQGKLPVWHLVGNETHTMVGNPGVIVVGDALLKGLVTDSVRAYNAMLASVNRPERGLDVRAKWGYLPYNDRYESVAKDLEYAIADRAVAEVARVMGDTVHYHQFMDRSRSYQRLFDPTTRFIRAKGEDGVFKPSFDPFGASHQVGDYCEGNAWQYTFLVPHDLQGLIESFGSQEAFVSKLDSLFTIESTLTGDAPPDITGLIGQYAHGNEPSHHIAYYYTMLGLPHKTADLVRYILYKLYSDQPDGLSGNEDAGQMSAWYMLSALGFYQVEPAGGHYYFGSPIVDGAKLQVRHGTFAIEVKNNSVDNKYIQSVTLNGKPHTRPYLTYEEISHGGQLVIEMGAVPTLWYPYPY